MSEMKIQLVNYNKVTVDILNPKPEDYDIQLIAATLSHIARWTGHTIRHLSVAEHSVWMAETALTNFEEDEVVSWCLLHDASEVYLGDVPTPLKKHTSIYGHSYKEIEARHMLVIQNKYGLVEQLKESFHMYDNLAAEREYLAFFGGYVCEGREVNYAQRFLTLAAQLGLGE